MHDWTRADHWRAELVRAHGAVSIDDVVAFGIALLGELDVPHQSGRAHGALRPEVISVARDGQRLRVRIDTWPTDPKQETVLATGMGAMRKDHAGVHYRAPEQFTSHEFDARADCFAVGAMLYELATGRLPSSTDATEPFKVFLALKHGGFASPRELRQDIPHTFAAAIVHALALRPEERFADVATMAATLRVHAHVPSEAPAQGSMAIGPPIASPLPARPAPDHSAVPDPLRPIETGVLPVATQAAIAAYRRGQTQPSAAPTPAPADVPLPIRALVEATSRPEPAAVTPQRPTLSRPVPAASAPPLTAGPRPTPATGTELVTRRPIVMLTPEMVVPPRTAPAVERPTVSATVRAPQPSASPPMLVSSPARPAPATPADLPPEPTVVSPPPVMEPPRRTRSTPVPVRHRAEEPTVVSLPATVRTSPTHPDLPVPVAAPSPAPVPTPLVPKPSTAPVERPAPTVVAPAPLQDALRARIAEPDAPSLPTEDTARKSAGEVTPPDGNASVKAAPLRRRDVVILSGLLLLLGVGGGLLFQLPSQASSPAVATPCVPGPEKVCPPPEPVAMPDPTPVAPVVCEPPKPSPRLTCFYDGYSKGQRLYLRGDRRGALEAFHAAETCMPRNPRLLQWLGRCYEELRDRDQARTYYERYLRRRPRADDADYFRQKLDSLEHPNGGAPRDGGTK